MMEPFETMLVFCAISLFVGFGLGYKECERRFEARERLRGMWGEIEANAKAKGWLNPDGSPND